MSDAAPLIPYFAYRDSARAIEFLCAAFGFERMIVIPTETGGVTHAELHLNGRFIMLGDTPDADSWRIPAGHGVYVYLPDDHLDAAFGRAVEAGAEVVHPPMDTGWGSRRFRLRDPEGYEWSFGSYYPVAR